MDSENDTELIAMLEVLNLKELVPESIWEKGKDAIESIHVPENPAAFERPSEVSDFKTYLHNVENTFKTLESLLQNLVKLKHGSKKSSKKQFVVSLLILCGEHSAENTWTTRATVNFSLNCLRYLCQICNCESVTELLVGNDDHEGLFAPAVFALRPKLLKNTWKAFPSAVTCYYWMLIKVKSPHLGDHLNSVLPTALILVDDFVEDNMILGIKCLQHIVKNVTRTELEWYGQGEVIYKTLEPLLYQRKAEVLPSLCSCLATFLEKVESGYIKTEKNLKWTHHDDVLEILLQNMEMEQGLALRKAYITSLPTLLQTAQLRACRWTNRLLRILKEYMEVAGYYHQYQEALFALKALLEWMTNCWPVVHYHTKLLLQSLLRLVFDFSIEEEDTSGNPSRDQIMGLAEKCLILVVKLAPEESAVLCTGIKEKVKFNSVIISLLERVFVS